MAAAALFVCAFSLCLLSWHAATRRQTTEPPTRASANVLEASGTAVAWAAETSDRGGARQLESGQEAMDAVGGSGSAAGVGSSPIRLVCWTVAVYQSVCPFVSGSMAACVYPCFSVHGCQSWMRSARTRCRADEIRATGGVEPRGFPLQQPVGRQRERMPEDHAARQCQCDGAPSKPLKGISLSDKYSILPVYTSLPETRGFLGRQHGPLPFHENCRNHWCCTAACSRAGPPGTGMWRERPPTPNCPRRPTRLQSLQDRLPTTNARRFPRLQGRSSTSSPPELRVRVYLAAPLGSVDAPA